MIEINTPLPAIELASDYQIKGGIHLKMDEVIVPVRVLTPNSGYAAAGVTSPSAVVGQNSYAIIFNPLAVPITVYRIVVQDTLGSTGNVRRPTADIAGAAASTNLVLQDFRLPQPPGAVIADAAAAAVPGGVNPFVWATSVGTPTFTIDCEITLGIIVGQRTLLVSNNTTNRAFNVTFHWRERPVL